MKKWTNKEISQMVDFINFRRISLTQKDPIVLQLSKILNRSTQSITKKLSHLKYKDKWESFVAYYYQFHTMKEVANRVGMSESGVEKVLSRVKKKDKYVVSKLEHRSPEDVLTLMRSSNLPSYYVAQFSTGSSIHPQKLFDRSFGIPSKWVHGMLYDDYFDLFDCYPDKYIKTTMRLGSKYRTILVPWLLIPFSEILEDQLKILRKYQIYLYGCGNRDDAMKQLNELMVRPIKEESKINYQNLKDRTMEAYKCILCGQRTHKKQIFFDPQSNS